MQTLEQAAQAVREALRSEQLEQARVLVLEYREMFDEIWGSLAEEERRHSTLPREALEFLRWAHTVALALRVENYDQRRWLLAALPYQLPAHRQLQTWQLIG